jgi:hypothetical protein
LNPAYNNLHSTWIYNRQSFQENEVQHRSGQEEAENVIIKVVVEDTVRIEKAGHKRMVDKKRLSRQRNLYQILE